MKKLFIAVFCFLPLAACATIDVTDMTPTQRRASLQTPESQNVVIRATNKLYSAFRSKGLVGEAGQQVTRMSELFLTGLPNALHSPEADQDGYASWGQDIKVIRSDIRSASLYVSQTQKAADIFLEVTPYDEDLSKELQSLEMALSACYQAETTLKTALKTAQAEDIDQELAPIEQELASLRRTADQYGERVRSRSASITLAAIY